MDADIEPPVDVPARPRKRYPRPDVGRVYAQFPSSPSSLQRGAVVAFVSFLFFLITSAAYLLTARFVFVMLAAGFFVVYVFTFVGWLSQRKRLVEIATDGVKIGKQAALWNEIDSVTGPDAKTGITLGLYDGSAIRIPSAFVQLADIAAIIRRESSASSIGSPDA